MDSILTDHPHRRRNPLTGEWVLVSPHRSKRPWQGMSQEPDLSRLPEFDPSCYLCPGVTRAGGETNPDYASSFVFTNDFASLLPGPAPQAETAHPLLRAETETGECRVICYSPDHSLTMARMDRAQISDVVTLWQEQYRELGMREDIGHVQIFENRGEIMGCSNPHPHGQIWANRTLPDIPAREDEHQARYRQDSGSCLLCDYAGLETEERTRIVVANDSFLALVPFWAVWPFETMILPRRHMESILEMDDAEKNALAEVLSGLLIRYDNLFSCSFPYSMGLHQAPTDGRETSHWHWHMHFYPPLLRSSSVRKFMVGYEMMAMPQRDLTAEASAARLAELSPVHYLDARTGGRP